MLEKIIEEEERPQSFDPFSMENPSKVKSQAALKAQLRQNPYKLEKSLVLNFYQTKDKQKMPSEDLIKMKNFFDDLIE
jgi:hypothetical protein